MPMRRENVAAALKYMGDRAGLRRQVEQAMVSPEDMERQRIQGEIRQTPWFKEFVTQYGEEPDLSPNADYDYITAWKSGIRPERDPYDQNRYHWSSKTDEGVMLKKPGHSTLWKTHFMDQTGQNPDAIGVKTEQQAQEWIRGRK
jgi:hypothetical protein